MGHNHRPRLVRPALSDEEWVKVELAAVAGTLSPACNLSYVQVKTFQRVPTQRRSVRHSSKRSPYALPPSVHISRFTQSLPRSRQRGGAKCQKGYMYFSELRTLAALNLFFLQQENTSCSCAHSCCRQELEACCSVIIYTR